jgi:hypothetical protein
MKVRSLILVVACAFAMCLATTAARADVIYTFSATSLIGGQTSGFQYTAPSYLTNTTTLIGSQLTACQGCGSLPLLAVLSPSGVLGGLNITFVGSTSGTYTFPIGLIGNTYSVWGILGTATLTVTSVPEPATMTFAFLGLVVLGFLALRHKRSLQMTRA